MTSRFPPVFGVIVCAIILNFTTGLVTPPEEYSIEDVTRVSYDN